MGHPQPIKIAIIKKCPKLPRIYSNVVAVVFQLPIKRGPPSTHKNCNYQKVSQITENLQ